MNWAVIMAGGFGERFWPMSRRSRPKQLLAIVGRRTMIQDAAERLRPLVPPTRIVVVTNAVQAREVHKQLPRVKHVIAEPVGRNTAPCIALAAAMIARLDPNAAIAVVPADSWVGDVEKYRRVVGDSLALAAERDVLITIGIQPTAPHTGYGYIRLGEALSTQLSALSTQFWKANRFVEKPDVETAKQFLATGEYRWNAGMFVWSVRAIGRAFEKFQPAMAKSCARLAATKLRNFAREYQRLEKISVDYAIMERADNVVVANGDFPWDDVGDWPAIARHNPRDANGNVARGALAGLDAANCVVVGDPKHLIAAVGVRDLVIVHTPDATLVCHTSEAQKVRELVKRLAAEKRYQKIL
ncbi:MAG TPA: sugar phosphate nucleotidyltransferase [Verrucomicrobiae bacterium]|nr:sugar phosphate nucleotidyltransferase [Verrucomicrobiae bacterium]